MRTDTFSAAATAAAPAAAQDPMSTFTSLLPKILMFIVLWFLMIRPQMKKAKEHKALLAGLAKGDEVVTQGGIVGKVTRLSEGFLHIEIASGVEVQMQRSAVVQVLPKGSVK